MAKPTIATLRGACRGQVITPDDSDHDTARKVHNSMIDRRPSVIVRAVDAADVMTAVHFARENGLDLSIRGGSHSVPGFGTNDGGVVIDRPGAHPRQLQGQLRPARLDQEDLRPREPVPHQPEHQAVLKVGDQP
jgi:FAD/FMN-containing dehydrogenase